MFHPLLGDDGFDNILRSNIRHMNSMMSSMLGGDMFNFPGGGMSLMPFGGNRTDSFSLMNPFQSGFMTDLGTLGGVGSSYSSSTIMTMGPDGKPEVYRESSSTIAGPGGVRETKKSVQDSRSGMKKMSIGHYIGERGHVKEREHNARSGQQEENEEFINLDEDEAETFNHEFEEKVNRYKSGRAHSRPGGRNLSAIEYRPLQQTPSRYMNYPALTSSAHISADEAAVGANSQSKKKLHHTSKPYSKKKKFSKQ